MNLYTDTTTPFRTELTGQAIRSLTRVANTAGDTFSGTEPGQSRPLDCSRAVWARDVAVWGLKVGVATVVMASNQAKASPDSTRTLAPPVDVRAAEAVEPDVEYTLDPVESAWTPQKFATRQAIQAYIEEMYADH